MKTRTKSTKGLLNSCTGAFAMVIALGGLAYGQAKPNAPQPSPGTVTNPDMNDRSANVTLLERSKDEANRKTAALKQMNEDFQRLQTEDAEINEAFESHSPPDYKKISEGASDIRIRASRLKNQLALPAPAKRTKEQDGDKDGLKAHLSRLSERVKSFVGNPIFQQQAQQQADGDNKAKARLDLDDIILLSSRIAKAADAMEKEAAKTK